MVGGGAQEPSRDLRTRGSWGWKEEFGCLRTRDPSRSLIRVNFITYSLYFKSRDLIRVFVGDALSVSRV